MEEGVKPEIETSTRGQVADVLDNRLVRRVERLLASGGGKVDSFYVIPRDEELVGEIVKGKGSGMDKM